MHTYQQHNVELLKATLIREWFLYSLIFPLSLSIFLDDTSKTFFFIAFPHLTRCYKYLYTCLTFSRKGDCFFDSLDTSYHWPIRTKFNSEHFTTDQEGLQKWEIPVLWGQFHRVKSSTCLFLRLSPTNMLIVKFGVWRLNTSLFFLIQPMSPQKRDDNSDVTRCRDTFSRPHISSSINQPVRYLDKESILPTSTLALN